MIYDRTIADVEGAQVIIETKVKAFLPLTEDEINTLERGVMTIGTLNRIEAKQNEVKQLLNKEGYYGGAFENKTWEVGDYFMESDLVRLANNTALLRKYIAVYSNTPQSPKAEYHFEEINKMEKILVDLEQIVAEMKTKYRRCNTFRCGEV